MPEKVRSLAAPLGRAAGFPPGLAGSPSPPFDPARLRRPLPVLDAGGPPATTTAAAGNLDRFPGCLLAGYISRPTEPGGRTAWSWPARSGVLALPGAAAASPETSGVVPYEINQGQDVADWRC